MELYQTGDFHAFEILYRRHSGRLYEYLKKKVPGENTQDLLQETFVKLHSSREKYNSQYPFLPWLFTVTRNVLFDFFKKAETQNSKLSAPQKLIENMALATDGSTSHDFSELLLNLPENQKRAIELRYLNEWSFEKISNTMNTTPENVRQIISRGIKKIRQASEKGDS